MEDLRKSTQLLQTMKFTQEALAILQSCYESNPYPKQAIKEQLAEKFNVNVTKIYDWFVRKRRIERSIAGNVYVYE